VDDNISKEPAAFTFRVEVTGMWMWLGCIHIGSITWMVVASSHRDGEREIYVLGSVGIINKEEKLW
jgi:hypothetical protein